MAETKHTPGPWEVGGQAFRVIAHFDGLGFWEIANAAPTKIVGESGMTYDAGGDVEANARLIAAAPDLLEALEEIRDMLWSRPDISDRLRPLMGFAEEATNQKAARAIAKAKGET